MTPLELQDKLQSLVAYDIPVFVSGDVGRSGATFLRSTAGTGAEHLYYRVDVNSDTYSGQMLLLCGLHEVGHTHVEASEDLEGRLRADRKVTIGMLENEAQAWHWALDYCERDGIYLEADTVRWIGVAFGSYIADLHWTAKGRARPDTNRLLTRLTTLADTC
jgi:hypothetical protein